MPGRAVGGRPRKPSLLRTRNSVWTRFVRLGTTLSLVEIEDWLVDECVGKGASLANPKERTLLKRSGQGQDAQIRIRGKTVDLRLASITLDQIVPGSSALLLHPVWTLLGLPGCQATKGVDVDTVLRQIGLDRIPLAEATRLADYEAFWGRIRGPVDFVVRSRMECGFWSVVRADSPMLDRVYALSVLYLEAAALGWLDVATSLRPMFTEVLTRRSLGRHWNKADALTLESAVRDRVLDFGCRRAPSPLHQKRPKKRQLGIVLAPSDAITALEHLRSYRAAFREIDRRLSELPPLDARS